MFRSIRICICVLAAACTSVTRAGEAYKPQAPLLTGMGRHHHPITTSEPWAQRFFDQGLVLAYGFNHLEARRAFDEVTRLDSNCAMGYWGVALVLGPNINAPMDEAAVAEAWAAVQKAVSLSAGTSPGEQALIAALVKRYAPESTADRALLDSAYAEAMRVVHRDFPDDPDAGVLFAEALMDQHPWDYWYIDGQPRPWTLEIVDVLEAELEKNPNHPGANHLYIHAVEASKMPGRATVCADRLPSLVPGAGHLVHMPSHIYIRTGRYHEGSLANEAAIKVDDKYLSECRAQGVYELAYVPHNHHFLWATATMEGASAKALAAARSTSGRVDQEFVRHCGFAALQHYSTIPLFAMVRFGKWDDILAEPSPDSDLKYPLGIWHYARGMAYARTGRFPDADKELALLLEFAFDPALENVKIWEINSTQVLLKIAVDVLSGEIAAGRSQWTEAIKHLEDAASREDELAYQEPPDWFFPVRQVLGAVYLEAGEPDAAEAAYLRDLEKFPENGWSLYGLKLSLEAQGKAAEAADVEARFKKAWVWADVTLPGSRF